MKSKGSTDTPLVWSSEHGRICPGCSKPIADCNCRKNQARPSGDGTVRVRRETKGRGGKTVTVVTGVPLDDGAIAALRNLLNPDKLQHLGPVGDLAIMMEERGGEATPRSGES